MENADVVIGMNTVSLQQAAVAGLELTLGVLLFIMSSVLLIASAKVANLTLVRPRQGSCDPERSEACPPRRGSAFDSTRGSTPPIALGSKRIMIQLLIESVLLALVGGGVGLYLADDGARAALTFIPAEVLRFESIGINSLVLPLSLISSLAILFFRLTPILRIRRLYLSEPSKKGSGGPTGSEPRAQRVFVVAQVALALVLLAGAGLLLRSLINLWELELGFNPQGALILDVRP
jgi:hypothetical protein